LHWLAPRLVGGLLPAELIRPFQPAAIARGVLLGLAVARRVHAAAAVGLRRVPPVRVLRRDAEPVGGPGGSARRWARCSSSAGRGRRPRRRPTRSSSVGYFAGGLVLAVGLLALAAAPASAARPAAPPRRGGLWLRHGLAHVARPGTATVGATVALGLGVSFVFATRLVERHLSDQLRAELPADAPTTFLVDVQPDQWPQLEALLRREGATGIDSRPIVTARFAAVNGVPVDQIAARQRAEDGTDSGGAGSGGGRNEREGDGRSGQRRWVLTREQRITYGDALPRGNRVTAGAFPSVPAGRAGVNGGNAVNGVSVEEGFARDLGVGVGSTLSLDVQGAPVEMTVTSLRTVDWRTFGINFFLVAEAGGPLDAAPQTRVAVARVASADLPRVQAAVVTAFPNVTVIHVKDVMDKVLAILENLGLAVRALGAFTVAAGVVVMGGTIAATQARRAREVALLKTVGMTRRDVAAVYAVEVRADRGGGRRRRRRRRRAARVVGAHPADGAAVGPAGVGGGRRGGADRRPRGDGRPAGQRPGLGHPPGGGAAVGVGKPSDSALSTQHSALSTQHFLLLSLGGRPRERARDRPAPDDEAIGCGGSIRLHADRGDRVVCAFLTSGELGVSHTPPEDVRRLREAEAGRRPRC
jgi:putative ABC transport system permease protein